MSRWKFGQAEYEKHSSRFAGIYHRCVDDALSGERPEATSLRSLSVIFRIADLAAIVALLLTGWGLDASRAQQPNSENAIYARAVEYCRGDVQRPMALDRDKRVLCLDGEISRGQDVSLARSLGQNGLFVVRSPGGDVGTIVALADFLQDQHATVVVYDYCLLACASYLLFASTETFVLKDSLVAWRYWSDPLWCPIMATAKDEGPKRLKIAPCSGAPSEYQDGFKRLQDINREFYVGRGATPLVEWPPQSVFVRKLLQRQFEGTGAVPNTYWTWNPRHYAGAIKTKIVYEAYPKTQEEVDAIAARIHLYYPVAYDP
jgi:hypothetical protein